MKPESLNDELFEVMLKHAVHDYWQDYVASLPSEEELEQKYPTSAAFDKKMYKICAKLERRRFSVHLPVVLKKTAAVFVMLFSISSLVFILSPTVQAAVKEVTMHWFNQYTSYEYSANASDIKNAEWEFTYIPKGYKLTALYFLSDDMVDWEYTDYAKDELLLIYTQKAAGETVGVDNEHSVYSQIKLNGVTADLYTSNEADSPSYLIWSQKGYAFTIASYLDKSELIKIAESIKLIK